MKLGEATELIRSKAEETLAYYAFPCEQEGDRPVGLWSECSSNGGRAASGFDASTATSLVYTGASAPLSRSPKASLMGFDTEKTDPQLFRSLTELLREAVLEKQAARERAARTEHDAANASRWGRAWMWLAANTAGLSTMVTVLSLVAGAVWTINQYLDQQRERAAQEARAFELERRKMVASFALELSDPVKRNGVAYALAVLAGADAIPLLKSHLVEAASSEADVSFRTAIEQALITIGPACLNDMVRLNRDTVVRGWQPENKIMEATQTVITHFIRTRTPAIENGGTKLAGVMLTGADLSFCNLDGMDLSGVHFSSANLCGVSLQRAILSDTLWNDSQLGSAKLAGAILARSEFRQADLGGADLSEADLTGCQLSACRLSGAKLRRAMLAGSIFTEANLVGTDFSGADLSGAVFVTYGDTPAGLIVEGARGNGALVVGASFEGAQNIDKSTLRYLCRGGATNVPGGCEGIAALDVSSLLSGVGRGCF